MKNIEMAKTTLLEDYDVVVNHYLTLSQIQQIANAITKFETWAEREQNKLILVLAHATNIGLDELEKHDFEIYVNCGLVDKVVAEIKNFNMIDEAIKYVESPQKHINKIMEMVRPVFLQYAEKIKQQNKNGKLSKK